MICPACHNIMIVVEHDRIELDWCPDCAGVWFDAEELELLLETMNLESSMVSTNAILTSPEAKSKEKKRKCPICHHKMRKATVGHDPEVLIDVCATGDGLWFDAGEVVQLISQVASTGQHDCQGEVIKFLGEVFHATG